jgi:hypothetical protein
MHGWGSSSPSSLPTLTTSSQSLTTLLTGLFFLLLFLLVVFAIAGWIIYTRLRASRQGLPPPPLKSYIPFLSSSNATSNYPTPRSSGPLEWIKDQLAKLRNQRTARGAYEETGRGVDGSYAGAGAGGAARGRDDDAWDTRAPGRDEEESYAAAGPGGYYEEAELGLAPTKAAPEPYGGAAGRSDYTGGGERGRWAQRGHGQGAGSLTTDPFGDQHEASSLRSVSPRPVGHGEGPGSLEVKTGDSPIERRSMFREGL